MHGDLLEGPQAVRASQQARWPGLALIAGGVLWVIKAATILATGYQPPQIFELAQVLFALGLLGLWGRLARPAIWLAKAGAALAAVALASRLGASLYERLPGAVISTGEEFVVPYSPMVLLGAAGVYLGLILLGTATARTRGLPAPWHLIPLGVGAAFGPLALTGVIHVELPILLMGLAWMLAGAALWRSANNQARGRLSVAPLSGE
jgi:hypothetical protein